MSALHSTRPIARLLALGAALAVALLGLVGTASANEQPGGDCGYEAPLVVEASLVLSLDSVRPGQATTATATVRVDGKKAGQGTVTFSVAGTSATVPISDGQATFTLPTDLPAGTYEVTADAEVSDCALPAGATAILVVEDDTPPDDDVAGDDDDIAGTTGSVGRSAPTVGGTTSGWLPDTGLGSGTSLVALAGGLLLAVGAVVLLRARRLTAGRHRA